MQFAGWHGKSIHIIRPFFLSQLHVVAIVTVFTFSEFITFVNNHECTCVWQFPENVSSPIPYLSLNDIFSRQLQKLRIQGWIRKMTSLLAFCQHYFVQSWKWLANLRHLNDWDLSLLCMLVLITTLWVFSKD